MDYLKLTALDGEVRAMEQGLDTVVGSSGVRLSGGQAQRLALARTLAHPRPIFVIDDPFSALDRATKDAVFANLRAYARDKVVFLISHRLYHFPEMQKIVLDNIQYAKVILKMGYRKNAHDLDFSDILEENVEEEMKKTALISTGTDISDNDLKNIQELATQVLDLAAYRVQLFEYLQNRMHAVAPNLSVVVGELVGARLIAHAGSLMNLAKFPASTVQILGAEKALFRALKTRHETPKYGLIYHASLVGQAAAKHKGKISRVLAVGATRSGDV